MSDKTDLDNTIRYVEGVDASDPDRMLTQLAGCLAAAQGATNDVAERGTYGWSPAYQAVLDLRRAYDADRDRPAQVDEACIIAKQRNAQWRSAALGQGTTSRDRKEICSAAGRTDEQISKLREALTDRREGAAAKEPTR